MSSSGGEARRRPGRRRNLLEAYYGIEGASSDKSSDEQQQAPASMVHLDDPTNLDSPAFDASLYVGRQFRTLSLTNLIEKSKKIGGQTRALDSEMKTLVYENYSKFLSAADTVHAMQSRIDLMQSKIDALTSHTAASVNLAEQISSQLQPRRTRISELSGIAALLERRAFLFELPDRLRTAIRMDALHTAVEYREKTAAVLQSQATTASLASIKEECDSIVGSLKTDLITKALAESDLVRSVELLQLGKRLDAVDAQLGDAAVLLDWDDIEGRAWAIFAAECLELLRIQSESDADPLPAEELQGLFWRPFILSVSRMNDAFPGREAQLAQRCKEHLIRPWFLLLTTSLLHHQTDAEGFCAGVLQIHSFLKDQLGDGIPSIVISAVRDRAIDWSASIVAAWVKKQSRRCKESVADAFAELLTLNEEDAAAEKEVVVVVEEQQDQAQTPTTTRRKGAPPTTSSPVSTAAGEAGTAVVHAVEAFVQTVAGLFSVDHAVIVSQRETVALVIVNKVQQVYLGVAERATAICEDVKHPSRKPGTVGLLLLTKFCLHLSNVGIPNAKRLLERTFLGTSIPGFENDHEALQLNAVVLKERLRETAARLLHRWTLGTGFSIAQLAQRGVAVADWMHTKEVRGVRMGMVMVMEDVRKAVALLRLLFPARLSAAQQRNNQQQEQHHHRHERHGSSGGGTTSFRSESSDESGAGSSSESRMSKRASARLARNFSRIFEERVAIIQAPRFDAVATAAGVCRIVLKALMDDIRVRAFSVCGFQQMQVDVFFVQTVLADIIPERAQLKQLSAMVEEILASCGDRCVRDPDPLDQTILDVILERMRRDKF